MYELKLLNNDKAFFLEDFLPSLIGKVFHSTTKDSWEKIKSSGLIKTNKDGSLGQGSIHSHDSVGKYLDAICFFDLRDITKEDIGEGSIFYDYFNRRLEKSTLCLLEISPNMYSSLITTEKLDESVKSSKMYIPKIESWYPSEVTLDRLSSVYELTPNCQNETN